MVDNARDAGLDPLLLVFNPESRLLERAPEKKQMSMGPRLHVDQHCLNVSGAAFALNEGAARHVQVLRLQPGDRVRLFDGAGGEWAAEVLEMGRKVVQVRVTEALVNERELPVRVTLAVGMPANDRMDALIEKATELGAHAIQPLVCARSVLRLDGERAAKKVAHWQAVAVSASEQCGRAVVPQVHPVQALAPWLRSQAEAGAAVDVVRGVLSLRDAQAARQWLEPAAMAQTPCRDWVFLSGPEGGLSEEEEGLARSLGWKAVSLGRRVLRADTAPLAMLSVIGARLEG